MPFLDRVEAGKKLAEALQKYKGQEVIVYGMPRGGVVTAAEIAKKLGAPLDLIISRKIGHPYQPEYAIAAVGENGELVENKGETDRIDREWFAQEVERQRQEAARRHRVYLEGRPPVSAAGKTAILVDDGIATGLSMFAAIEELKTRRPKRLVVAVPVAPRETVNLLRKRVDEVVVAEIPRGFFGAIGAYYEDFSQVEDEEVIRLIRNYQTQKKG